MRPNRIPLFPLNVVLLPGADLPLHIFEPRYREMVRDCLDNKAEFGMLLALENGIAGTGCTAEILEVAKKYNDGRMDILTVGRAPFRVVELFTDNPLLEGTVTISTTASPSLVRKRASRSSSCTRLATRFFSATTRATAPPPRHKTSFLTSSRPNSPWSCFGNNAFSSFAPKPNARSACWRTFATGRRIYRRQSPHNAAPPEMEVV